ncbi:MAG: hypothetical protein PUC33_01750 [Oscillospiraceae bacterium]|nr:hypothetical protein [Oscillospiraceae bacterium]MDD6146341.1 hypothetical protein [Oscillospiraceae bacterium]
MQTYSEVISASARRFGVSESEVRSTIEALAEAGLRSPDENIRYFWRQVPCAGESPTAEEIIERLVFLVRAVHHSGEE